MLKRAIYVCALVVGLAGLAMEPARAITVEVFAKENSSSGGTGALTGVFLTAGQAFTVSAGPNDLWSAGPLPRWSNADGLTGDRFVTGPDESGENTGVKIGESFGLYSQGGLNAPYGSLVGQIGAGTFFLIGTNFSNFANATGLLSLFYWDSNNGDNSGSILATVAVPGPIMGAGFPGLLVALGGLVVLASRRRNRIAAV